MTYDVLIIGAGITGCVLAERLASRGKKILIIDKRDHIGGNCYDKLKQGVMMHKYGSHQFRTNSKKVKDYLSKFTEFGQYKNHLIFRPRHKGLFTLSFLGAFPA